MAKTSSVEKNNRRSKLVEAVTPASASALQGDRQGRVEADGGALPARLKLAELPRNADPTRIRNRCEITGRPRAYYRKLKMSRIALRELGSKGLIPGLVKSSW